MGMQTDVKSGVCFAGASTDVVPYSTRLKGLTISYPSGGTVAVTDGNGGATLFLFSAPAAAGSISILIPGEGIRATTGLYVTCAASTTANVFYG
jgi:hypothetical protein